MEPQKLEPKTIEPTTPVKEFDHINSQSPSNTSTPGPYESTTPFSPSSFTENMVLSPGKTSPKEYEKETFRSITHDNDKFFKEIHDRYMKKILDKTSSRNDSPASDVMKSELSGADLDLGNLPEGRYTKIPTEELLVRSLRDKNSRCVTPIDEQGIVAQSSVNTPCLIDTFKEDKDLKNDFFLKTSSEESFEKEEPSISSLLGNSFVDGLPDLELLSNVGDKDKSVSPEISDRRRSVSIGSSSSSNDMYTEVRYFGYTRRINQVKNPKVVIPVCVSLNAAKDHNSGIYFDQSYDKSLELTAGVENPSISFMFANTLKRHSIQAKEFLKSKLKEITNSESEGCFRDKAIHDGEVWKEHNIDTVKKIEASKCCNFKYWDDFFNEAKKDADCLTLLEELDKDPQFNLSTKRSIQKFLGNQDDLKKLLKDVEKKLPEKEYSEVLDTFNAYLETYLKEECLVFSYLKKEFDFLVLPKDLSEAIRYTLDQAKPSVKYNFPVENAQSVRLVHNIKKANKKKVKETTAPVSECESVMTRKEVQKALIESQSKIESLRKLLAEVVIDRLDSLERKLDKKNPESLHEAGLFEYEMMGIPVNDKIKSLKITVGDRKVSNSDIATSPIFGKHNI